MSLIIRILFILAGFVAALFVARDTLNFDIMQMFVVVLLVTGLLMVGALWSVWRRRRTVHHSREWRRSSIATRLAAILQRCCSLEAPDRLTSTRLERLLRAQPRIASLRMIFHANAPRAGPARSALDA